MLSASDIDRFISKVYLSRVKTYKCCWIWKGAKDYKGYGHFWVGGRTEKAHRVS